MRLLLISLAAALGVWSAWVLQVEIKRPGLRAVAAQLEASRPVEGVQLDAEPVAATVDRLAATCRDDLVREATTLALGGLDRALRDRPEQDAETLLRNAARRLEGFLACTPGNGDIWFHYARVLDRLDDSRAAAALVMSNDTNPFEYRTLVARIRYYRESGRLAQPVDAALRQSMQEDMTGAALHMNARAFLRDVMDVRKQ